MNSYRIIGIVGGRAARLDVFEDIDEAYEWAANVAADFKEAGEDDWQVRMIESADDDAEEVEAELLYSSEGSGKLDEEDDWDEC